ncbi:hypothetical protein RhiirC2_720933 [Rhizophagus irregularis]|uniref:Uncharacterized protein n=1 Tax=Rhizophagus irregularis TaxID=588596 RepID=A0A2N1M8B8_9GLOM|nr:hypothetical protein RhiirC2_720933 [Rhizophagus irregularis]
MHIEQNSIILRTHKNMREAVISHNAAEYSIHDHEIFFWNFRMTNIYDANEIIDWTRAFVKSFKRFSPSSLQLPKLHIWKYHTDITQKLGINIIEDYFHIADEHIALEGVFEKKHLAVKVEDEYSVVVEIVKAK